jgi:hypothetical protein
MKVRNGFVSNSSSSSFMIPLSAISAAQRVKIMNHVEESKALGMRDIRDGDAWSITETDHAIKGWTMMDNFDMGYFLSEIGVRDEDIHWEYNG